MNRLGRSVLALICISLVSTRAFSQGSETYGAGARFNLDSLGTKYIRLITWVQIWTRYQEQNPGTIINGVPFDYFFDITIRRARFLAYGSFGNGSLFMFHVGINNQTFINAQTAGNDPTGPAKRPQIYIHDIWYEQRIIPELYIGFGLNYWKGLSRMTNASTLNFMGIDSPIFSWPTIDASDQFVRMPAIYIKGQLFEKRLDYRFALNQPFKPGPGLAPETSTITADGRTTAGQLTNVANYNPFFMQKSLEGYVFWQFFDIESQILPFMVGSYLGTKRVFNIGAGFYYHGDGMSTRKPPLSRTAGVQALTADSLNTHPIALFGIDAFLELPFGEGAGRSSLTAYALFARYDFGPNNVRYVGIMNMGSGFSPQTSTPEQRIPGLVGNAYPMIGTGNHLFVQAGYTFPKTPIGKFMPYFMFTYSQFDRLKDPMILPELGLNYFVDGHHAKFTLHYRLRPTYRQEVNPPFTGPDGLPAITRDGSKNELILQSMVYF
ncbi:MAG: hypothetical protein RMI34_09695 [Chloroherpetonaceae bacterium]|nr:hypothetical protein [Chloroherpetonaceae bacterium]MCS7210487.1 hypothetical protein [Chloroherpetonaceae bacterium]MDW8020331.1 hypothetical protein [Chloroherpetonaceae bacterium]